MADPISKVKNIKFERDSTKGSAQTPPTLPPASPSRSRTLPPAQRKPEPPKNTTTARRASVDGVPCRQNPESLAAIKERLEITLSKDPTTRPTLYLPVDEYGYENEEATSVDGAKSGTNSDPSPNVMENGAKGTSSPNRGSARHLANSPSKLRSLTRGALDLLKRRHKVQPEGLDSLTKFHGSGGRSPKLTRKKDAGAELQRPPKAASESLSASRTSKWRSRMRLNRSGFMLDPDRNDLKKQEVALHFQNSIDEMVSKRDQFKAKFKFSRKEHNV